MKTATSSFLAFISQNHLKNNQVTKNRFTATLSTESRKTVNTSMTESSIGKIMTFVNQTFREAKDVTSQQLLAFALSGLLKLSFLYGLLWVITRFAKISIG